MHKQGPTIEYHQPLSAAGCMLCALYFVILAVLPLIPSQITRVLKPVFLIACVFSSCRRYPMSAAAKVQSVFLIYLFLVLVFHPLTPSAIETYISIFLFGAFFIFASMRVWNAREIRMLLDAVVCSGVIMSAVCIFSNDGLLHVGSSQHIRYLSIEINRNSADGGDPDAALPAAAQKAPFCGCIFPVQLFCFCIGLPQCILVVCWRDAGIASGLYLQQWQPEDTLCARCRDFAFGGVCRCLCIEHFRGHI